MKTVCPVCLNETEILKGRIESHTDTVGSPCPMGSQPAPSWEERSTRVAVKNRSGGICEYCQKARATDMHHRVSRGVGGRWTPGNCIHLCRACHKEATEHPNWAAGIGLIVKSHRSPENVPVIREDMTMFQPTSAVLKGGPRGD